MKRVITRALLTLVLGASVALSVPWFTPATAQDPAGPLPLEPRKEYGNNSPLRFRAKAAPDDRTRKLLSDYIRTDGERERATVLDELTKVVSDQFDMRQEARERELKELEDHVRKLRELHQRRAKEKDQIVRDRVRQLLRDVEGLGWSDDGRLEPSTSAATPPMRGGAGGQQNVN